MERDQDDELRVTAERGEILKLNAIVVPADDEQPLRRDQVGVTNLADYQQLVGGNIEAVRLSDPSSSLYINEEGKLLGLPMNRRATLLAWAHNRSFRYADVIVGDAFLVGSVDRVGNDTNMPDEFVKMLFEAQRFRAEVQVHDEPGWHGNDRRFDNWAEAYAYVLRLGHRWTRVEDVRVVPEG